MNTSNTLFYNKFNYNFLKITFFTNNHFKNNILSKLYDFYINFCKNYARKMKIKSNFVP